MKITMKKLASLTLALLLLLALLPSGAKAAVEVASGVCGAEGDNLTWSLNSAGIMTISGSGVMADYDFDSTELPWANLRDSIRELRIENGVTAIGYYAFKDCTVLQSVSLPNTLRRIGVGSFWYCYSLTQMTIPASVLLIEDNAFTYCTNISEYKVEEGNPVYHSALGAIFTVDDATLLVYPAASTVTGIRVSTQLTEIKSYAFSFANKLESVMLRGNLAVIPYAAFWACSSLKEVYIPAGVTEIQGYAFGACDALTDVYFGGSAAQWQKVTLLNDNDPLLNATIHFTDDVHEIPDTGLTWTLSEDGTMTIGGTGAIPDYDYSYEGVPPWLAVKGDIKKLTLSSGVTAVGESAFYSCDNLSEVTFNIGLQRIGKWAFESCPKLTSISIPKTVTEIAELAFIKCPSLTSVMVKTANPIYHSNGNCLIKTAEKRLILGSADGFIPDDGSVTSIGDGAFYGFDAMTSVTIPNSVTSIGQSAFWGCRSLESVVIPNGVTSIGDYTFSNCNALTSAAIPGSVRSIGKSAFWGCEALTGITIPNRVTSIGDYAFYNCNAMTSVTIPDSVTSIGQSAFWGCRSLKNVVIPNGVTSIGDYTFSNCDGLTSVMIPDSVTSIGQFAFSGCSSLTSVKIPDNVTDIAYAAFYDCTNLSKVDIPAAMKTIGEFAFYECSALKDIYYGGDSAAWVAIEISDYNSELTSATIHFSGQLEISGVKPDKTTAKSGDTITWTVAATGGRGTLKYRFYIYKDGAAVLKGTYGKANTVSYTLAEPGVYTVRAYAKDEIGTSASLTGGAVTAVLAVPGNIKATATIDSIVVSWNAVSGAAKYRVIRTVDGVTTKIKVSGTSWTDTAPVADTNNVYFVQAQAADGTYSDVSESKSLYYPLGIAVKVSGSKANISWTAVTGATKYQMYRRPQVNGKYGDWELIYSAKGTSFVDTPGEGVWQYRVRAVVDGVKTAYSNRKRVTIN